MNNSISTSDNFSLKRMLSFGWIFRNQIKLYLCISIAVALLGYVIVQLSSRLGFHDLGIYGLMNLIVSAFVYLGALTFTKRDDGIVTMIPVRPIEKWCFYILYSLVVVPCVVYGVWYGTQLIFELFGANTDVISKILNRSNLPESDLDDLEGAWSFIINAATGAGAILTVLYTVLASTRQRTSKGILSLVGFFFVFYILIISVLFIFGFFNVMSDIATSGTNIEELGRSEIANRIEPILTPMMNWFSAIICVYDVVIFYLIYRCVMYRQVKS